MTVVEPETSTTLLLTLSWPMVVPNPGVKVPVFVNTTLPDEIVPKPLIVPAELVTPTDAKSTPPERLREFAGAMVTVETFVTVPLLPITSALPPPALLPTAMMRAPLSHKPPSWIVIVLPTEAPPAPIVLEAARVNNLPFEATMTEL